MLTAFARAFRTPDLRKKILFTLGIVAVYRLGSNVPSPGVAYANLNTCLQQAENGAQQDIYSLVNLDKLARLFPDGGAVDPDVLAAKGAVRRGQLVKILGTGEIGVALQVRAHGFSGSAREKINAAGGSTTQL